MMYHLGSLKSSYYFFFLFFQKYIPTSMHSPQGQQVQVAQQVPRHPDKNYIQIKLLEVSSF